VKEKNMIKKATEKQWQEIEKLKNQTIENLTKQEDDEEIRSVVKEMWKRMGYAPKAVLITDCPVSGSIWLDWLTTIFNNQSSTQLYSQLVQQLNKQLYSQLVQQLNKQLDEQLVPQLNKQLYEQLYSQLASQLNLQLGLQLRKQLRSQLYSQLSEQLNSQLRSQLYSQLSEQLYTQLNSQLFAQLNSQLNTQLCSQLHSQLGIELKEQLYTSIWWRAWPAWYKGGKILGVKFDEDKYQMLLRWTKCAPILFANGDFPIVFRWPEEIHWQGQLLHNESGPSVRFRSGYSLWTIDGIPVNKQIVMQPETQTIEQMEKEENQDVKAIRIDRFGWVRYIKESGAKCIDKRKNEVEGTKEALFHCKDDSTRLVVTCPTKRIFSLGVPPEVKTCEQAQTWLAGEQLNIIAAT
jgi:hypothetical protein